MDLCVFSLGASFYGIPVLAVEEIFRPVPITVVPGADPRIAGIINLRGSSAAVIDLRHCLAVGENATPIHPRRSRMLLLETAEGLIDAAQEQGIRAFEEPVVLLADQLYHVFRCDMSKRHPAPPHMQNNFISGVYEYQGTYLSQIDVLAIIRDILQQGAS